MSICSLVPMPNDNSIISQKACEKKITVCYKSRNRLTLLPSLIDHVLALSSAHLLVACALVKYLSCIGVSVVDTNDPMAPALA